MRLATAWEYLDSLLTPTSPGLRLHVFDEFANLAQPTDARRLHRRALRHRARSARASHNGAGAAIRRSSPWSASTIPASSPSAASARRAGSTTAPTRRSNPLREAAAATSFASTRRPDRQPVIVPASAARPGGRERSARDRGLRRGRADHSKLLVFTNSARVWRAEHARRLLGARPVAIERPSAKARRSGRQAVDAHVRQVLARRHARRLRARAQHLRRVAGRRHDHAAHARRLDHDHQRHVRLGLRGRARRMRDGFRWSPDGKRIAYWQLDATGVRDFLLINNTDSLYSFTMPVQYPKAGTTNSAARIGVVSAAGGPTTWLEIPGDPRNNYLARMDWAAESERAARAAAQSPADAEHVLRRERDDRAARSRCSSTATARGSTSTTIATGARSVAALARRQFGVRLPVASATGGGTRTWSRETGAMRLITPGEYDVMKIAYVDTKGGWLYYDASPTNATQMFLWRIEARRVRRAGAADAAGGARHARRTTSPRARIGRFTPARRWARRR